MVGILDFSTLSGEDSDGNAGPVQVQKLAEIEAELETLRALGNHPNIVRNSAELHSNFTKVLGQSCTGGWYLRRSLKSPEAGLIATATINRVDQNGKVRPHYKLVVMEVPERCGPALFIFWYGVTP